MSDRFDAAIEELLDASDRYTAAKALLDEALGRATDSYYTQHESETVADARKDFASAFAGAIRMIIEGVRNGR